MPLATETKRLRSTGGRLLAAFAVGAAGMFAGALTAAALLKTPREVAACLLASWTGGSVNFVATAQALGLPDAAVPAAMAADNLGMAVALAALMACPLRLVRRLADPDGALAPAVEAAAAAAGARLAGSSASGAASSSNNGSGSVSGSSGGSSGSDSRGASHAGSGASTPRGPLSVPAYAGDADGGAASGAEDGSAAGSRGVAHIDAVQAALQRQVTVPAAVSGRPIAKDGSPLLTEEPAASSVFWAAYQRSRERAVYDPPPGALPDVGELLQRGQAAAAAAAAAAEANGGSGNGANGSTGSSSGIGIGGAAAGPRPVLPANMDLSSSPGASVTSSMDEAARGAAFERGPLAKDGSPLLTAEPSAASLQAAYARSRDPSRDSRDGDDDGSGGGGGWQHAAAAAAAAGPGAAGARLTLRSAAASLAGAFAVCASARALVVALGAPHLFLFAVSLLALAASAASGAGGRALFAGASRLGSPLMGLFFAAIGATSVAAGVSLAALAPLLGFLAITAGVHFAVLLAGARALRLEPSTVLVASNALVGGPATAAGMAASRGWGRLVQPAVLAGSLSYAVGSAAGLLLGHLLGVLMK